MGANHHFKNSTLKFLEPKTTISEHVFLIATL